MNKTSAMMFDLILLIAASVDWGSPLLPIYCRPAQIIEATIIRPTPTLKKRISEKRISAMGDIDEYGQFEPLGGQALP